ncbi:MAG: alkaline phosphatase D family protein [Sphingomonadales bacterium]
MRPAIDRRAFLTAASAGLILPVRPALAGLWAASGFTHGVASGDPGADAITLWTRYVAADGKAATLKVELAEDRSFRRIIKKAEAEAGPATWGTAQVRLTDLPAGRWLWFRFTAPDGSQSQMGRTRTLPQGKLNSLKLAVFSCANRPFGWFNAYAHAAARDDIDMVIHLGDYLYEYKRGIYPDAAMAGREIEPANELIRLDDYRQRYASYRVDPALQELHRRFPMIAIWDDHEFANDTYNGGAENHQADEGDWWARRDAALQAHSEWLPSPKRPWQRYDFGDLTSVVTLDTRMTGRDKQLNLGAAIRGGAQALKDFAANDWSNPARTLLGAEQEAWAADTFKAAASAGQKWQLLAQQVVMGDVMTPKEAASWLGPNPDPRAIMRVQAGLAVNAMGISANMDMWSGYPQARRRLLAAAQAADADMVVISGDSHNAWAFDHALDGKPVGVEFAGHSVTSPGYESQLKADPALVAAGAVAASPGLKWADTSRRGYFTVHFTPDQVRGDYVFMTGIATPGLATGPGQALTAKRGARTLSLA